VSTPLGNLGEVLAEVHAVATAMPTLDFHTGQIIAWDGDSQTNQVLVLGRVMNNLPVLTSASTTGLEVGSAVGILRVRTQYFILGRIVDQTSGLVNPQFPIVLYPQFRPLGAAGAVLYWYVAQTSTGANWEGRSTISFPYIEVDGIWGCDPSPGNSATYELLVAGTVVGSWTETGVVVARRGPFDVRSFIGQSWARIDVRFSSFSGGATNVALQVLGCYYRDA
jgi:hypothetical protein